jgi:transposase-like protein
MAQRDSAAACEKALGPFGLSKSALRTRTETLSQASEGFRTRDRRGYDVAYLFIDTLYAPRRRWGSQTGGLGVGGICVDGRKGFLSLVPTHSESYESGVEVRRDLSNRGRQPPVTITTDGAAGPIKAVDSLWPRSLRSRGWLHKRQNLRQKGPPQAWPPSKPSWLTCGPPRRLSRDSAAYRLYSHSTRAPCLTRIGV